MPNRVLVWKESTSKIVAATLSDWVCKSINDFAEVCKIGDNRNFRILDEDHRSVRFILGFDN